MKSKTLIRIPSAGAFLLSGMLLWAACGRSGTESAPSAGPPAPSSSAGAVQFVPVEQRPVHAGLDLLAKVQADPTKLVRIFPPASGRVLSISVKPGDHVRRGQSLAVLQSGDVGSARADFAKAEVEAERANRAMERSRSLFEHGAGAEKDSIDARAAADSANAELERARQRLSLLNASTADSDRVRLAAPTDGVVLDVSGAPGEFSKSLDSANPLITLADLTTVWIVADLYEKDVAKVQVSKPVTVTLQAYPEKQWSGRIASVADALDPVTRTLKVRVVLENPARELKPEMFGAVHVDAGVHPALLIPATAVLREGDKASVFVQRDGKPEQRTVTLGATVGPDVEVLSGLRAGEQVAAQGAELLKGAPQ